MTSRQAKYDAGADQDLPIDQTTTQKHTYAIIFVVLVYRNTNDVKDLLRSMRQHVESYRVIIVNSYYDDKSRDTLRDIADENECDFIDVPNKGYGYGNNQGIRFALDNYLFDALIIANPDTLIRRFSIDQSFLDEPVLLCPVIKTTKGKSQNPLWVLRNPFSEWLMYFGHKHRQPLIIYVGIAINKFIREVFLAVFSLPKRRISKVYAAHGSFLIFSRSLLLTIGEPFDESMFLFSEEMYLARRLHTRHIATFMIKDIDVLHKEDGSMNVAKIDESSENSKSYIYYYEVRNRIDREG